MYKRNYEYNNIDLNVVKRKNLYVVCCTQYYYRKNKEGERIDSSERTWRWETNCEELMRKMDLKRTKIFTGQLIQLAKQFGKAETLKYKR